MEGDAFAEERQETAFEMFLSSTLGTFVFSDVLVEEASCNEEHSLQTFANKHDFCSAELIENRQHMGSN